MNSRVVGVRVLPRRSFLLRALAGSVAMLPVSKLSAATLRRRRHSLQYLERVTSVLEINTASMYNLAYKVVPEFDEKELEDIAKMAIYRMKASVGDFLESARATLPALASDDYQCGRSVFLHGVTFPHIEVALLYSLAMQSTHNNLSGGACHDAVC